MTYPRNNQRRLPPNVVKQAERLQGLVEDRGSTLDSPREDQRAITRANMAEQGVVTLQSAYAAGAAPTAAEHNALVDDVRAVAALLNKMGANFTWA